MIGAILLGAPARANTPLARAIREDRALVAGTHPTRAGSLTGNRMAMANLALYRRGQPMRSWSYDDVWRHNRAMSRALAMQDAFSALRRDQPLGPAIRALRATS